MEENTSKQSNLNDVIGRFNNILKDKNIDLGKILNDENTVSEGVSEDKNSDFKNFFDDEEESSNNFSFDFDLDTLLKLKSIFQKINDNNCPRNRLLYSLKPFLKDSRKQKIDEYIKIANILVVMNVINDINSLYLILIIILLTK